MARWANPSTFERRDFCYGNLTSFVCNLWQQVLMRQIDLLQVDTYRISPEADPNNLHINAKWRSALEIIVAHEVQEFAEDDMFQRLIHDKWRRCRMRSRH